MKILVIGPSDLKSRGGMATVISGIRNSKVLNEQFDIDIHASFIDGNIVLRLLYSIFAYLRFLMIFKKYDIFHIHMACRGSIWRKRFYVLAAKKAGKKCIIHIHGAEFMIFYEQLNELKRKKLLDFLKASDMVIGLSDWWKEQFEVVLGLTNVESLPNGIDTEEFSNAICDNQEHINEFVFLGRMGKRKGAYDLLKAVYKARKVNPDIKVYMAGDGEVDKIRELVERKNLENNIDVIGWVDMNGKMDLLKKSATFVLPSYNEGLPMAILESMASGKAIISTTVGAIPEVIKEENGIIVEPGDVKALAKALIKCSTNPEMVSDMGQNNLHKMNTTFSMKIMHERLAEYYRQL